MKRVDFKRLRKDINLTQSAFSERINIGQSYLSELENGRRDISKEVYSKLINAFGEEVINNYIIESSIGNNKSQANAASLDTPVANFSTGVPYYNVDFIAGFDMLHFQC